MSVTMILSQDKGTARAFNCYHGSVEVYTFERLFYIRITKRGGKGTVVLSYDTREEALQAFELICKGIHVRAI